MYFLLKLSCIFVHSFFQDMLSKLAQPYKGLSKEIWYIAFITLINRAGAMVVPFLSLYLTKHLHFEMSQVGWIMTAFGVGSSLGTFTGGKLTDRFGYLKVMITSLVFTGLIFFGIQFLETFEHLVLGIFILSFTADTYRPAIWVAMDAYSTKENRTRSVTLIRLAINLGFAVGPAVGGLIIAHLSYSNLFWIDGWTCIIAAVFLWKLIAQKKSKTDTTATFDASKPLKSPYRDVPYLIFFLSIMFMGTAFMQFTSTMPLYFDKVIGLSEKHIGMLIALNGLMIFVLEMPLVHFLEKKTKNALNLTLIGSVFFIATFLVLNIAPVVVFPILSMILITIGEMISFPFSNTFAMERSSRGKKGEYMALYTLTFSFANIFGPNLGLHISDHYGFKTTWYVMAGIMTFAVVLLYLLVNHIMRDSYEV